MDLGLLAALMRVRERRCAAVPGRPVRRGGDDGALVIPGGVGSDLRLFGKVAGSPIEDGSGHVRVREALRVLVANRWVEG